MEITNYLHRPVFLVGKDGTKETGSLAVYETFSELNDYLSLLSPASDPNVFILHGFISPATYIPGEIEGEVYIIVGNPKDNEIGCVYETYCECDAQIISQLVVDKIEPTDGLDYTFDDVTIDDIFIMYGYELNPSYVVNRDEIDSELLSSCSISSRNAEEVKREIVGQENVEKTIDKEKKGKGAFASLKELYMKHFEKRE